MRFIFKLIAWFVGAVIGITACAITLEFLTGKKDPFIQSIFGVICGALGWMLVGKKKTSTDESP